MQDIDRIRKIFEVAQVNAEVTENAEASDEDIKVYSIDGIVELQCDLRSRLWSVGHWVEIPGSYWEPSDVDYVGVHESKSLVDAVQHAISDLVTLRTHDVGYVIFPDPDLQIDEECRLTTD